LRQAARRARCSVAGSASLRQTLVAPCRPHPPFTGTNIEGSTWTNSFCCCGVSLTIPQLGSGYQSVAKILPRTRKSGCLIWALSDASGKLRAIWRKSSEVTARLFGFTQPTILVWPERGDSRSYVRLTCLYPAVMQRARIFLNHERSGPASDPRCGHRPSGMKPCAVRESIIITPLRALAKCTRPVSQAGQPVPGETKGGQ
jgi:hypothetical protein